MTSRTIRVAGGVIVLCIGFLTGDYVVARLHKTRDDQRVTVLQEQARNDHKYTVLLAALQDGMTKERLARKARTKWVSVLLIAAAASFVAAARRRVEAAGTKAVALERIVEVKARPERKSGRKRANGRTGQARVTAEPVDLALVDQIIEKEGRGTEAAIPILQAIQAHFRYLPEEALVRVCERTAITAAQLAGTSSFYSRFRRTPVGEHMVRVCHGTACHVSGARAVTEELRRQLAIPEGTDTDAQRMYTIEEVACLGCCSLAPVLTVDDHTVGKVTPVTASEALEG